MGGSTQNGSAFPLSMCAAFVCSCLLRWNPGRHWCNRGYDLHAHQSCTLCETLNIRNNRSTTLTRVQLLAHLHCKRRRCAVLGSCNGSLKGGDFTPASCSTDDGFGVSGVIALNPIWRRQNGSPDCHSRLVGTYHFRLKGLNSECLPSQRRVAHFLASASLPEPSFHPLLSFPGARCTCNKRAVGSDTTTFEPLSPSLDDSPKLSCV